MTTQQHLVSSAPVAPPAPAPTPTPVPAPPPAPTEAITPSQAAALLSPPRPLADVDPLLHTILSWPRGYDGPSEKGFQNWLIRKLNNLGHKPVMRASGCLSVEVPIKDKDGEKRSRVLFSCHTDTVHAYNAKDNQKLAYDPNFEHITLDRPAPVQGQLYRGHASYGECLGADDGVGVYIMLKMLIQNIPGNYVFHRGEEKGCIGSRAMATNKADAKWLKWCDIAVAFDRPKDFEVITHQGSVECCSQKFALALAAQLSGTVGDAVLKYEPSDRGLLTDTKQYRHIIAECTNIGVGYYDHHSANEYVDYSHLKALLARCLIIDWENLPVERKPSTTDTFSRSGYGYGGYDGYGNHASAPPASPFPTTQQAAARPSTPPPTPPARTEVQQLTDTIRRRRTSKLAEIYDEMSGSGDILDAFEVAPEDTARELWLAIIEGYHAIKELEAVRAYGA